MTAHAMKGDRERCLAGGHGRLRHQADHAGRTAQDDARSVVAGRRNDACLEEESIAAFDEAAALAAVDGDRSISARPGETFLQDCSKWLSEIEAGLAEQSAPRIGIAAHTLKGATQHFAAPTVTAAAKHLEQTAAGGNLADCVGSYPVLAREVASLPPEPGPPDGGRIANGLAARSAAIVGVSVRGMEASRLVGQDSNPASLRAGLESCPTSSHRAGGCRRKRRINVCFSICITSSYSFTILSFSWAFHRTNGFRRRKDGPMNDQDKTKQQLLYELHAATTGGERAG